jgi:hypothetical protein
MRFFMRDGAMAALNGMQAVSLISTLRRANDKPNTSTHQGNSVRRRKVGAGLNGADMTRDVRCTG